MTPYLVGIMDEFNRWETEEIIFAKPTQVGGTEIILNALGYIVDQDPAPTMVVYGAAPPLAQKSQHQDGAAVRFHVYCPGRIE